MVVNRRKKVSRQRASWNHGYGARKKNRGSGSRGGKGNAGTGKRADHHKPRVWKERYLGKFGFKKKGYQNNPLTIDIRLLEQKLEAYAQEKLIIKENGTYSIDLKKLGYGKLLGTGIVKNKLKIQVDEASQGAITKIQSKGGEVILPNSK